MPFSPISRMLAVVILTGGAAISSLAQAPEPGFVADVYPDPDQHGMAELLLQNRAQQEITAARITHHCDDGPSRGKAIESFDTVLQRAVSAMPPRNGFGGIAPAYNRSFKFNARLASCPTDIAVLYADGHGEGLEDGPAGWKAMIAARQAALDELGAIWDIVQAVPPGATDFSKQVGDAIRKRTAEMPQQRMGMELPDAEARRNMVRAVYRAMYDGVDKFRTKPEATQTLDRWMAPLRDALKSVSTPVK